jgi:heme/copper-type cytochrome/quinol oxidase subunit 3
MLRRKRFGQLWLVAAAVGFFAGFGISFLISEKPGVLLPADFSRNMVIVLSCALVAGQITGIMSVRARDSQDLQNVRSWIAAWNNRAVHPSPRSGNEG